MGRFEDEDYGIYLADRVAGKDSLTPTRDGRKVLSTLVVDGDDIITDLLSVNHFTIRHLAKVSVTRWIDPSFSAALCLQLRTVRAFSGTVRTLETRMCERTWVFNQFRPPMRKEDSSEVVWTSPLTAPKLTRPGETSDANQGRRSGARYLTSGQLRCTASVAACQCPLAKRASDGVRILRDKHMQGRNPAKQSLFTDNTTCPYCGGSQYHIIRECQHK